MAKRKKMSARELSALNTAFDGPNRGNVLLERYFWLMAYMAGWVTVIGVCAVAILILLVS